MEILYFIVFLIIYIIWQIFPTVGLWIYLVLIVTFLFFAVSPIFVSRSYVETHKDKLLTKLSVDDYNFMRKHAIYYLYPFGSRSFSSTCSFLQLTGIIFGVIFLIRGYWLYAIICGLNYLIFAPISAYLNKPFFLYDAIQRGSTDKRILREMGSVERLKSFMENDWNFLKEQEAQGNKDE